MYNVDLSIYDSRFEQLSCWPRLTLLESIKTTSVGNEYMSTWKNKEQYLRSKDKAEKWYDVSSHIYIIANFKLQKNEDVLCIMSNLQPNCCLRVDFQKVDQHAGDKWLIHDTKRRKVGVEILIKAWSRCQKDHHKGKKKHFQLQYVYYLYLYH